MVVVYHPSANRGAGEFADAFTFDIGRQPNSHLAFGAGPNFCLGSRLGRLLLPTMIRELALRYPHSEIIVRSSGRQHFPGRLRRRCHRRSRAPLGALRTRIDAAEAEQLRAATDRHRGATDCNEFVRVR